MNRLMLLFVQALLISGCGGKSEEPTAPNEPPITSEEVVYYRGEFELKGFLCTPQGAGPFPVAVYNHGGLGDVIGGAPRETCEALAQDGFVGFSPIRRPTVSLEGHLDDVFAAVEYVKKLDGVDSNRVAILGFSRGALLTFEAAIRRSEFKAVVIMAVAPGRGHFDTLLPEATNISAPVLLLVAENDTVQADHVQGCRMIEDALQAAGKPVELIIYPPYQDDGHQMFFEVGEYWNDMRKFLQTHLR